MSKQRNPNIDFGFHAILPRLVRTGYKNLTPIQKWLYVCLKDLCGDNGTCYRALRVLSEETGISTGMLSESIPLLHETGLIHAEKKKRSTGGKEVWHITIVDIWQANALAHPTKRSHDEQERSQSEQSQENVHNVNENVHNVNKDSEVCSQHERECSQCETEVIPISNTNIKAIPEKDRAQSATAIAPRTPESKPVQISDTAKPEKTTPKRDSKAQTPEDIPAEAISIMNDWDSLFKRPYPHTPDHIAAAKLLMICHPTKDDLKAVRAFIYKTNPEWYRDKGVKLSDIAKNFGKWQCQQEQQAEVKNTPPPTVSGRRRLIVPPEALAAMAAGGGR